jgi:phage gp29-like protein
VTPANGTAKKPDLSTAALRHHMAVRSSRPTSPILDMFGRPMQQPDAPPRDPLADVETAKGAAMVLQRQIPITTIQTDWTIDQVRNALNGHVTGMFDLSSQLIDAITGDDRVQATLGSRCGGLFGRPVQFTPANDSDAAKEVCTAWERAWPRIAPEAVLSEVSRWTIMGGWYAAPLAWDTTGPDWIPTVQPWHPRYTFYLPQVFSYYATTQEGITPIEGGSGKWFLHTPHGGYRGWMRGAVRAVAQPWLIRNFAYRDWARYSERHGMPMIRAYVPAAGDPTHRDRFVASLQTIGQETVVMLPQGVDEAFSYDVDVMEASDQSWQAFPGLIDRCDMSIVLALLYQNLTTEVKEGSFAAARVHGDVRQSALASDNSGFHTSIRFNLARPFAAFNYGDPELAPWTRWDVEPVEDRKAQADVFNTFCSALKSLKESGWEFDDARQIKTLAWTMCGLRLKGIALKKAVAVATGKEPARAA